MTLTGIHDENEFYRPASNAAGAAELDYDTLDHLRLHHPAWRLLCSDHAPLIASFLHRVFIAPNQRLLMQGDLAEALEDELFALRERTGDEAYPKAALAYLNDWAEPEKGWLRKFYQPGVDEPCFYPTPATEKAVTWLSSLTERSFVGTESRLRTLFELLRQMSAGAEADPDVRIEELHRRREEIDAQIEQVRSGDLPLLDDTALKDRFQQFRQMAQELLADFREVDENFRSLDRRTRERIALWEGSKGTLLEDIMSERDGIEDSDQGRNFHAFWEFLMSSARQEELTGLLKRVLALDAVAEMNPAARTRRIHYDWLEACEHTQRTVARLSAQLRRFLDDRVWLENRRIMDILHGIETKALELQQSPPRDAFMSIDTPAADVRLPMERRLYRPPVKPLIADVELDAGDEDVDASALFTQVLIDKQRLAQHIRSALQTRSQITLRELCELQPLQHGLAELVGYLELAGERPSEHLELGSETFRATVDETVPDPVFWHGAREDGEPIVRQARVPRVIFVR